MSLLSNRKSLFIATVTAATVFVMFGYVTLKPEEKPAKTAEYSYVTAKNTIKKGSVITEEDVVINSYNFPIQDTYKATGEIIGRKAASDITAGKPIMAGFIEKIKTQTVVDNTPRVGYRAVSVMIASDNVPKDVTPEHRFDFLTPNNLIQIDNVRILDVAVAQNNKRMKLVSFEIKDKDVQPFLDNFSKVKSVTILKKNPEDYGEYKFKAGGLVARYGDGNIPADFKLPPVDKISADPFNDFNYRKSGQVEVIVGSAKKTMEFSD